MNKNFINKIKILREKTGISFIECKNALMKNNLDIHDSIIFLRKNGHLNMNKIIKGKENGLISVIVDDDRKNGVIVEINCKTDFVTRLPEFKNYVKSVAKDFLYNNYEKNFLKVFKDKEIVSNLDNKKQELISKISEDIIIKKVKRISVENNLIFGYTHGDSLHLGRIGTIIITDKDAINDINLANDISMQVAAMNPKYLSIKSIPKATIDVEKMIGKQLQSFYKENVLLEQFFIKNTDIYVKDIISKKFKLLNFIRFEIGK